MQNIKAMIIHLQRAHERHAQVEHLKNILPVKTAVIDAVDAHMLGDDEIADVYRKKSFKPHYPFTLSRNEIACFLSHRKAWQSIVDEKLTAGFILEDDIALLDGFDEAFAFATAHIQQAGFIRFPFRTRETGVCVAQTDHYRLLKPVPIGLGQVAQMVSYEAAQTLLAKSTFFDRPVDTWMQMFWQTDIHSLTLLPPVVEEISAVLGGTTVQKKGRSYFSKLHREIARPLYRKKVGRLSRQKDA